MGWLKTQTAECRRCVTLAVVPTGNRADPVPLVFLTFSASLALMSAVIKALAAVTNAVVAMLVSLSPGDGVGAVGLPVKVGLASGARVVSVG